MAANEQEHDRTEPATPFKLREARRRGQVARSLELTSWLTLCVAVALGWMMLDKLVSGQLSLSRALFDQSGHIDLTRRAVESLFAAGLWHLLATFGMFAGLIVATGLIANFMQVGPVFSWHPLKPDFTRLNPAAGFKRLFNARLLYESFKTVVKLALVAAVLYALLRRELPSLAALEMLPVQALPRVMSRELLHVALGILCVLGALAAFDLGFVKWDFARRMRMSRRELREEIKRRDGDPKIKAKIRELQREAARRGAALRRVPDADVLVTNPTHLSVALRYRRGTDPAPIVIAKGSGELAMRMRQMAARHRVPTIENRPVAQALFRGVGLQGAILPETYPAVARILLWAYRQRGARA
jgi:flagellar biosynthesis protein FlhB